MNYSYDAARVISWSNRKNAEPYLKKKGYFGNSLDEIEAAVLNKEWGSCIDLNKIYDDVLCFQIGTDWNDYYECGCYGLFLPEGAVNANENR